MARRKKDSVGHIAPESVIVTREQKITALQKLLTLFSVFVARTVFEV